MRVNYTNSRIIRACVIRRRVAMKSGYGNIDLKKTVMVLIAVMILTALSLGLAEAVYADGDEPATSGKCGEHMTWSYADGTLTIAGSGDMDDSPWDDFTEDIENIVLSNAITSISGWAFQGCKKVTSVTLPSQLEGIGEGAFAETGLTSIFIPQTVTYIRDNPFRDCPDLTSIRVDTDNYEYSDHWHADGECNAILKIYRDPWDDSINDKIVDVVAGCKNTIMPRDVNQIMPYAFAGCTGLKSVTFRSITPDDTERPGLTFIGAHAFDGCVDLEGLFIPYTVTNIGEAAFGGCGGLESIEVAASNEFYYSSGNTLIQKNGYYYDYVGDDIKQVSGPVVIAGCKNSVIPSTAKAIGASAFCKCSGLTKITIPEGVRVLQNNAFRECADLESVIFPESSLVSIQHYAFLGCTSLESVTVPDSVRRILSGVFMGCTSLKKVVIPPADIRFAESLVRDCSNLESFTFPSGVTEYGECFFWGCTGLKYVVVPVSLTENLGWSTFYECVSMTDLYYEGTREQFLEDDFITLNDNDTFVSGYTDQGQRYVKVHFNSTGPEDVPHEHSYSKTWSSDAESHWHECTCGDKADVGAHDFDWVTDKQPTATEYGFKHEECDICGYKRNQNTPIDPTGSDPVEPVTERYASAYTEKDSVTYTGKVMSGNIIVYDRETMEDIPAKGNYDITWSVDGKSIGKQKFTVTFKGDYVNSDPYKDSFTILPGKEKITSVKPGKKQAVVKYKSLKGGVKYQVAYRISGAWKTKTTSATSLTIKKLKSKKTYQFRIRALKTVKGKTYYGAWSAVKKAKIK